MLDKQQTYRTVLQRLESLLAGVSDEIACLATVSCEVFQAFESFSWVGFYRVTDPGVLMVGPYQGGHGCLKITFDRGVCGAAARTAEAQLVPNVHAVQDHIACSSSTQSELVVPVFDSKGAVVAVFDLDSDDLDNFDEVDSHYVTEICALLTRTCYV